MRGIIVCLIIATLTTAGYLVCKTNTTIINKGLVFGVIEALTQGEQTGYGCRVRCPNGAVIDCFHKPCSTGEDYVECGDKRISC